MTTQLEPVAVPVADWLDWTKRRWAGAVDDLPRSTGLKILDNHEVGLNDADLIILGGRPSMGKTSLAVSIALNVAKTLKRDEMCAFFSAEMSARMLLTNLVAQASGVPISFYRRAVKEIDRKQVSDEQIERWQRATVQAIDELQDYSLFIDDSAAMSVAHIQAAVRSQAQVRSPRFIVVDFLQQLSVGKQRAENRNLEIGEWARTFKELAKELACPVLVLSQLSRAVENDPTNPHKIPDLQHLRDSGEIEQVADQVWFAYRPEYYQGDNTKPEERGVGYVLIAKQRQGKRRVKLPLRFNETTTAFSDPTIGQFNKLKVAGLLKY